MVLEFFLRKMQKKKKKKHTPKSICLPLKITKKLKQIFLCVREGLYIYLFIFVFQSFFFVAAIFLFFRFA